MVTTVLLVVIYLAFIGLGIPDSLFGAAWPSIYSAWGLPYAAGTVVNVLVAAGTIVSSLFAVRVINRLGTGRVTALSTLLTALMLLGFRMAPDYPVMCLFALPLGIGAGAIDIGLNNYVALHYRVSHMNWLHCFYGIGVTVSPWILSGALARSGNWRSGYDLVILLQLVIAAASFGVIPLFRQVSRREDGTEETKKVYPLKELFADRRVRLSCYVFIASCSVEFICGNWGCTYLVEYRGLSETDGAALITLYYLGITMGRLVCGFTADRMGRRRVIRTGQVFVAAGILLLLISGSGYSAVAGLFLIGFGNGSLFPNLLHLTPTYFGEDRSQSVMGVQMASAYLGIMVAPAVFGFVAHRVGMWLFPPALFAVLALMAVANRLLERSAAKAGS